MSLARQVVELRVGGQTYRVVTTGSPEETRRIAALLDERVLAVTPRGKSMTHQQAMFLAAMSLAQELTRVRDQSTALIGDVRQRFQRLLGRVDEALDDKVLEAGAAEEPEVD